MKKLMMIAMLTAATVAAHAQEKDRKSPQERAHMMTGKMTKELSLDTEQAAKIEAINLKYADQVEAMRAEREAEREARLKDGKGKAMREAHDAEIKAVLTPEQYVKWQAQKEEMKAKHMEKRKEHMDRKKAE